MMYAKDDIQKGHEDTKLRHLYKTCPEAPTRRSVKAPTNYVLCACVRGCM